MADIAVNVDMPASPVSGEYDMDKRKKIIIAVAIIIVVLIIIIIIVVIVATRNGGNGVAIPADAYTACGPSLMPTGRSKVLDDGKLYYECQVPAELAKRIGTTYNSGDVRVAKMIRTAADDACYALEDKDERAACLANQLGVDVSELSIGSRACTYGTNAENPTDSWGYTDGCVAPTEEIAGARLYLSGQGADGVRYYDPDSFNQLKQCIGHSNSCATDVNDTPSDMVYARLY